MQLIGDLAPSDKYIYIFIVQQSVQLALVQYTPLPLYRVV